MRAKRKSLSRVMSELCRISCIIYHNTIRWATRKFDKGYYYYSLLRFFFILSGTCKLPREQYLVTIHTRGWSMQAPINGVKLSWVRSLTWKSMNNQFLINNLQSWLVKVMIVIRDGTDQSKHYNAKKHKYHFKLHLVFACEFHDSVAEHRLDDDWLTPEVGDLDGRTLFCCHAKCRVHFRVRRWWFGVSRSYTDFRLYSVGRCLKIVRKTQDFINSFQCTDIDRYFSFR